MKRKFFVVLLLFIVVAAIIGYRFYSKQTPDIVADKPDASLTAMALTAAFDKDTSAAAKQYLDKVLAVSGTVKKVDTSGAVVLAAEGESTVSFSLDRRHKIDATQLKEGEQTTLQGHCVSYKKGEEMMGVSLGTTVELNYAGIKKEN